MGGETAGRIVIVAGVGFVPEDEDLVRLVKKEEIPAASEGECELIVWPEPLPADQVEGDYGKAYLAATIPVMWDAAEMAVREQKGWSPRRGDSFRRLQVRRPDLPGARVRVYLDVRPDM